MGRRYVYHPRAGHGAASESLGGVGICMICDFADNVFRVIHLVSCRLFIWQSAVVWSLRAHIRDLLRCFTAHSIVPVADTKINEINAPALMRESIKHTQ